METIVITLSNSGQRADLEMPVEIPLGLLLPPICIRLGWVDEQFSPDFRLTGDIKLRGRTISYQDSLAAVGARNGDLLTIDVPEMALSKPENTAGVTEPSLISESGKIFPLRGRSIIIGRPDPGRRPPDIDLTPFDRETVTSRRHAQIWLDQNDTYWIKDLHSTNGLILDGRHLSKGERVRLTNGSKIQFGANGPLMTYKQMF
jgi:hypothetical protein